MKKHSFHPIDAERESEAKALCVCVKIEFEIIELYPIIKVYQVV